MLDLKASSRAFWKECCVEETEDETELVGGKDLQDVAGIALHQGKRKNAESNHFFMYWNECRVAKKTERQLPKRVAAANESCRGRSKGFTKT